jgi:type II secretory pathway component PulM
MKTLVEAWRARPERERSLLGAGALVIGVMLYVGLVWVPLERLRTRLAADLPVLRASIVSLERDAAEVKRLRATPSSIPQHRLPLASLMAANAWGRELPGVQVTIPDDRHVKLSGADMPFTALLDWIATAQAAHGLRVESARIDALAAPGHVRAELTLARN